MQANTNRRLLLSLDCTQEYGADRYFSCGTSRVVEGAAGRYREAEAKPPSRFGYRFRIEHVGRPHLAVIRYPDDRRRFMTVNDGTTYDLSTGITTGHAYPLSNTMQEIHQVFWPRWEDCSLCFMTWGFDEQAAQYRAKAEEQRRRFHANHFKKGPANYGLDHMTYLAEPLLAEVPPKEDDGVVMRALEHSIRVVAKGHPQSGDGGTHNLLQCLLTRNRPDLVYLMANQTNRPSWGAMVLNGDASIWEHWFLAQADHSRSHTGYGAIGEWFLNGLAGIRYDPAQPGFQHAVLRPYVPPDMEQLTASAHSVHGPVSIRWQRKEGTVTLETSIPPNTTATLFLPVAESDAITEAGRPLSGAKGVKLLDATNGTVSVELGSGAYVFGWKFDMAKKQ